MKVIARANLPTSFPVSMTLAVWIAQDYYNAPGWLKGALALLGLIAWIGCGIAILKQVEKDVINN